MAHVAKYNRSVTGHMFSHYDRSKENLSGNINSANTVLNYNLAADEQPMGQLDFLHKRLGEIKVQNRKDVNVFCDWVVTLPQTLNNKGIADEELFFKEAYKFLADRYGNENVISAYVHMDETTPHMHFAFVPVTEDKRRGGYKLSAKELINRQDLRTFHEDLSRHMEQVFGRDIGILNGATREGNKSIAELKRNTAIENLKQIEKDVSRGLQTVKKLEAEQDRMRDEIKRDMASMKQVKDVPHTKALVGDKQVMSTADFEALCKTASMAEALLKEIKPARKINAREKEILSEAQQKADEIIRQAEKRAGIMREKLDSIKYLKELEHMRAVIDSSPALSRAFEEQEKAFKGRPSRGIDHER